MVQVWINMRELDMQSDIRLKHASTNTPVIESNIYVNAFLISPLLGPMIFRDRGKRTEFAEFAPRNGKRDLNLMEKTSAILLKKTIFFNLLVQNELLINSTRFNR